MTDYDRGDFVRNRTITIEPCANGTFMVLQGRGTNDHATTPDDDTHSVVVRYRSDIGEGDRVIYRGRTLDITKAGDLNGRRAYLAIRAREVHQ